MCIPLHKSYNYCTCIYIYNTCTYTCVAARIDICTLHFELVLEHSVLARVSHVYAQYISVIVYAYNQSCLGNVHTMYMYVHVPITVSHCPQGRELLGGDVSGHLCVRRPWPGMARSIYGDHERFLETYYRPYPGTYMYIVCVCVWGGGPVCPYVCVCVHALFMVGLMLHYILVPGGGLTLELKVNIHVLVQVLDSSCHCCIHVDILCI